MELVFSALTEAQARLEKAGLASAVIGGIAVAVWGIPRTTQDVDLKVLLDRSQADRILHLLFPDGVSPETDSFLRRTGILFVQSANGIRVDYLLADTSLDQELIRRRVQAEVAPDVTAWVCTAEDLLILKLISTRPRDYEDAVGVAARQKGKLDVAYVRGWLHQFELALADSTLVDSFNQLL